MKSPLTRLFSSLFGHIHWDKPSWLGRAKSSPGIFWGISLLVLLLGFSVVYGIHWYRQLPKPHYITAHLTPPDPTRNEEPFTPNDLIIQFGLQEKEFLAKSVAPIEAVGKAVTQGIEISPQIKGEWIWDSDSQLRFIPKEDWPAGQRYRIRFKPELFSPKTKLDSNEVSFSTTAFHAAISEFRFYQDPVNPDIKKAVATIQFNFPVDAKSLEENTRLVFQTMKKGKLDPNAKSLGFSYTYDKHRRVAYLHSAPIDVDAEAHYLLLSLNPALDSASHSDRLKTEISKTLLIPEASRLFQVTAAQASIIRDEKDKPEQLLSIETSLGVNEADLNKALHLYVLPQDYPATHAEDAKPNYAWQNPGEVTADILTLATALNKKTIPSEQNNASLHGFTFHATTPRFIYLKIDKGLQGLGGFRLNTDYTAIIPVPEYPKEIRFLHQGSLLALNSEKKLSVLVRGLPAVKFDFARVLPENVNQLITQTQGDFNNPYFINPSFNQQNISQIFSETQAFNSSDLSTQQYTALDLGKYLHTEANPLGPQGLFLLQATGWDPINKQALDLKASRLILVTDLGLLVKDNHDGSHDVFVTSITQGTPVVGSKITLLGKNGLPIVSELTDAQGRVHFPSVNDFIDDREPTVYLASLDQDVSFIPFNRYNRQLNFSKFDISGIYTAGQDNLTAYLFSDRGLYRPGDLVHLAMIIKQEFAKTAVTGLPLQMTLIDPRGTIIKEEKITLNETGLMSFDFPTTANALTGQYMVNLFLVKDEHPENLLGSTSFRLAEFQPDRMRISSSFDPKPTGAWISPVALKAKVNLWNLYGAPATGRKLSAKLLLTPQRIAFDEYPDYVFIDPLFDAKNPPKVFSDPLADAQTDQNGQAEFDLHLERFEKASYQLNFFVEGFEAGAGRSVMTQISALVSPLPYFVGYKADGDLSFIQQNAERRVDYIAIDPQLTKQALKDLKLQLFSERPITTLVKKADGSYQYQSLMQSSLVNTTPFELKKTGNAYALPTKDIGNYALHLVDAKGTILSQLRFSIVGQSQAALAKNAELSVKLNKEEYQANEDIQLQITAPYTGSGLITIERDKIFATQWFKTDSTNSVQTIHIPADFQGNGYVNVAFIRAWDSPELFMSPLSYQVIPFHVSHEAQAIHIELTPPTTALPGEDLQINYRTDKPSQLIIFAVDEGILQVAHFLTPDPLAFFFQKRALEVFTQQTVDQILPQFILDRERSAAGGDAGEDGMSTHLNPFKRKTDLPVVFWSGILNSDSTGGAVHYKVPDYFNGSLKIMAVAVSKDSLGSTDKSLQIHGHFVINPNVPTFVAPGDIFEVTASVANQLKGSGEHAQIKVSLEPSDAIEIIGQATQTLDIPEGEERLLRVQLRAKNILGAATIHFNAQYQDKSTRMDASLSVRPATPLTTTVSSGQSDAPQQSLALIQTFYPEHRHVKAHFSTNPLILIFGLQRYLENFPYLCTEQLVSKAFALLAMHGQNEWQKDRQEITEKIGATIDMLSQRQRAQGGFSYWPGMPDNTDYAFISVYAMHFLTEAREQNFSIPSTLFSQGLNYLKDLASQQAKDLDAARIQAYAIYLLTRNEVITTNYLSQLEMFLQQDKTNAWTKDLTTVYLAASYQLLKNSDEANRLLDSYHPDNKQTFDNDFYNQLIANAQTLYLLAKHFPERLAKATPVLNTLVKALNQEELNTLLSGYTSIALAAYALENQAPEAAALSMTATLTDGKQFTLTEEEVNTSKEGLDEQVKQITFNNPKQSHYFYQLVQAGFDKHQNSQPVKQGIEISREYRNTEGQVIQSTKLGTEIEVHLSIRALDVPFLNHIAIVDLLPGGFEVVPNSIHADNMDFVDVREDRVNFFGSVDEHIKELVYRIKAVNVGEYFVPPAFAEAMYQPSVQGRGIGSMFTVE